MLTPNLVCIQNIKNKEQNSVLVHTPDKLMPNRLIILHYALGKEFSLLVCVSSCRKLVDNGNRKIDIKLISAIHKLCFPYFWFILDTECTKKMKYDLPNIWKLHKYLT